MGKIKKGILGGFSGRVGNVIGGSWKGIDYMRSEATIIADPKTAKQLEQRSKFRVAVEFAKQVVPIINIGLKAYATKRSEFNYLVSKICKDYWDDANDNINYPLVQLSAGELPSVVTLDVSTYTSQSVDFMHFEWESPEGANGDDKVVCFAYSPTDDVFLSAVLPFGVTRADDEYNIALPDGLLVASFHCWLFFYDSVAGVCSNSVYRKGS